jgi:cell wall-associated NlpC family hydrolase
MNPGDKGICRLGLVPVRAEAADTSEQVTQLLFGDHYEILEDSAGENWLKIRIHFDQYEGWIDTKQHTVISEEYYDQINNSDYKISLDIASSILHNKHRINILLASVLPISTSELFQIEEQLAYNGESKSLSQKRDFEYMKQIALMYLNAPYQWGGKTPFGIDCSGFTQQVFRICGYRLMRDASQQIKHGREVVLNDALPGDLAFFQNEQGNITHVGIVWESAQIIHASGKVRIDQLDENGILNLTSNKHSHQLHSVRRLIV